jgi:hypothetical protein
MYFRAQYIDFECKRGFKNLIFKHANSRYHSVPVTHSILVTTKRIGTQNCLSFLHGLRLLLSCSGLV